LDILPSYNPRQYLRSESLGLVTICRYHLEAYGGRWFTVYAGKLWNNLDIGLLHSVKTIEMLKRNLKSDFFRKWFL
jgi:hypothetical protein